MYNILFLILGFAIVSQGRFLNEYKPNFRIVNGTSVKEAEIPFQVSLQSNKRHFCGGSILNQNYVVTAAHCVRSKSAEGIEVIVGTVDLDKPYMSHEVANIKVHEKYNAVDSHANDVALIKVKTPFVFSELIQPVDLPKLHTKIRTNATAVVSGWGRLGGETNIKPTILQKAQIWVADQEYCRKVMLTKGQVIHPTQICANDPNTRRGQCNVRNSLESSQFRQGDSGGPLIVNGKLTGIVSWSIKDPYCASTQYPGVYTRVPEFVDWILEHAV